MSETMPLVLSEFFINAIKVGVPGDEDDVRTVIDGFNVHVTRMASIVRLAPLDYAEFLDRDEITPEQSANSDWHHAFDHLQFAEVLSDYWTTMQVLFRNGVNEEVRAFTAFLDTFVLGVDVVDHMDSFDF